MRPKFKFLAIVALMLVVVSPVLAQKVEPTSDDGGPPRIPNPWTGPTGDSIESDGDLTTLFAGDNQFAGNMFDLEVLAGPLTIESFDVNIDSLGTTETVQLYYREGGSVGFEDDPSAWTFFGEDTGVITAGADTPTPVDIAGLVLQPGIVYGLYIHVETYGVNDNALVYTNGGPNVYLNADLQLTTNSGNAFPAFGGTFFPRQWNGTVYYNYGAVPTLPWLGLVLLAAVLLTATWLVLRRTRNA